MKKLALALILLALPCCKWGKKDEVVDTTYTTQETVVRDSGKEVANVEVAGYAEEDGYDNERLS